MSGAITISKQAFPIVLNADGAEHVKLGDLARGLAVEMAVWEAFDLFALTDEEGAS